MKKSFVVLVLGAFMSMCFCQENEFRVMYWNEYMNIDFTKDNNKYENIPVRKLFLQLGNPTFDKRYTVDDEWLRRYGSLNSRITLNLSDEVRRIIWNDMENTFLVVSDKIWDYDDGMHSATRHCFFDEVFAVEKGGEWVVFASRRNANCLIPMDD